MTNFDLSVKDWRGNVIGYRCVDCGGVFSSMWGNVCNGCRERERRHRELIAAIKASKSENPKMTGSTSGRKLYREGDTVTVHHLIYPGPRPFAAQGRVIKCLSPTYYEIEYIDHRGKQCVKRFMRSQLP